MTIADHLDRATLRQLGSFALVGVVNTAVYAVVFLVALHAVDYLVAHVVAFVVSMVGSFFLNCRITYRVRPTLKAFLIFPLTNAASFVVSTSSLAVLVSGLGLPVRAAVLVAAVLPIPVTFLLSRRILAPASSEERETSPAGPAASTAGDRPDARAC